MSFVRVSVAWLAALCLGVAAVGCGDSDGSGGSNDGGGSEGGNSEGGGGGGNASAQTYVLVHGAFAGAWTWDRVAARLEESGQHVLTVELPAHGEDPTTPADATLDAYTAAVVDTIDGAEEPVVLVGHSMGGLVVSQAAEARPDKVKQLVYLAAFLVEDGTSLLAASSGDEESSLQMYLTPDGPTATLAPEGIPGAFCTDCSEEDVAAIEQHLRPEPLAPFTTPIHVTQEAWGSVPRVYIETLQDHAIGPSRQKQFYTALPCDEVISIDAGHCPFLTKPDEVADALLSL
ncbi:MAG: alpha/beta fold hydrolase [Polyangiaceae bacterium]|nr:alpha/beta fold hydrolase [Polyangiaceae bacterium]